MTKTGKIACVGGDGDSYCQRSRSTISPPGAKAVRPDVDVRVVFIGDEKDIAKAKQQTEALLSRRRGCRPAQCQRCRARRCPSHRGQTRHTCFMGANSDQSDLATKQNLGSFVLDVPNAFVAVGKRVAAGEGDGKPISAGLAEHAVYFQFNPRFAGTVPQFLKDKMVAAERDIIAGKVPLKK